jgi:hypothetical protein
MGAGVVRPGAGSIKLEAGFRAFERRLPECALVSKPDSAMTSAAGLTGICARKVLERWPPVWQGIANPFRFVGSDRTPTVVPGRVNGANGHV